MLRAAGIVALIVFTACGQNNSGAVASPSPVVAQGNWTQNLAFAGAINGRMTGIVADTGDQVSACTGTKTRNGEQWADTFFGTVDTGETSGQVWAVAFVVNNFRGPGVYHSTDVSLVVRNADKTKQWANQPRDKVNFTLDASQQSGSIDAPLSDVNSGKPFSIGNTTQAFQMPANGTLFLGVNDDHVPDNSGNYVVKVWEP